MFPDTFQSLVFFQKKRNVLLFKAQNASQKYILKSILAKDPSAAQAFCDEFIHLSGISHPAVPAYYGLRDNFVHPLLEGTYLTLCMEDCTPVHPANLSALNSRQILSVLCQTGRTLSFLLDQGILYTDLNPSNILAEQSGEELTIKLIDYTYCYYFKDNPHPLYSLRFSYNLDPSLRGQQLLIQELAYLLHELLQLNPGVTLPSGGYMLLESGLHPQASLTLAQYLLLTEQLLV